ncbi:hypothetical protein PROQFM164_S02g000405 [Penicillium roqueforti FM164]|uniref:Uncharacterized protein n=1 Tax=Penicillium roqueforti (strain FM164) TaxID=1365484 RepID=W6Q2Q9_PENRF|nr:hypothetical protein PROQFM164_S02g000405 [Penicillium roqueforti FM164]
MAYRPAGLRRPTKPHKPNLHKRGRSHDDDSDSSRSPTRRRLNPKSPESPVLSQGIAEPSASPLLYPIPDDSSTSSNGMTPIAFNSPLGDEKPPLSDDEVCGFHEKGAAYQAWIANPTLGGCHCGQARQTLFDLFNNSNKRERFTCPVNHFDDPPKSIRDDLKNLGLPITNKKYRFTRLFHYGYNKDGDKKETQYQHSFAKGALIAECIYRYTGPHWSNVAIAQYSFDHPIDTLKYIYFTNIVNEETLPYVQEILYPRHDLDWPTRDRLESHAWEYGTEEYRELLGTQLGKAAACVVLGAWERGTRRIARIHTIGREYEIHLRFDIEAIQNNELSN